MQNVIEFFQRLAAINEVQTFFQLILIVILAGIVGYERESWKKPAGFRTYVLVGISSVLVMVCGRYLHYTMDADPTRIPAQLLSGIGFLGAGTILRDGFNVKGLTTAAALLAVTCIGLAVGSGYYIGAIIATVVVYFVLSYSHIFSGKLEHMNSLDLLITSSNPKSILEDLKQVLDDSKLEIVKIKIINDKEEDDKIKIEIKHKEKVDINHVMSKILSIHTVKSVLEVSDAD